MKNKQEINMINNKFFSKLFVPLLLFCLINCNRNSNLANTLKTDSEYVLESAPDLDAFSAIILENNEESLDSAYSVIELNEVYVIAGNGLYLRSEPSISSQTLKTIPFGTKLTIQTKTENLISINNISSYWYQVQYENATGWVFGGYLAAISNMANLLIGDWQTEMGFFRFYQDGKYNGGRKHSSLVSSGNWFLDENYNFYLIGSIGDDSGDITTFVDVSKISFLEENEFRFSDQSESYKRSSLSYIETGLLPME